MANVSADATELWCSDINDSNSNLLKVTPPDSVKQIGLIEGTPFARVWHNFYFNYILRSLSWMFEERYKVGSVVTFKQGAGPTFSNWRGTWVSAGTGTIGSLVVEYWERTV